MKLFNYSDRFEIRLNKNSDSTDESESDTDSNSETAEINSSDHVLITDAVNSAVASFITDVSNTNETSD